MKPEVGQDTLFMNLFELALGLPPHARRSRLAEACSGNAQLIDEVMERVTRHEQMKSFLLEPLLSPGQPDGQLATGDFISDRFLLTRQVGEGGMGVVYEAMDTKLDQRCALKVAKSGFALRLPPEARSALRITHENVCRVYGIYTAETSSGRVDVLAMEYLDGETLSERLARAGPLRGAEAMSVARQVCAGLGAAHREGVLHRDLKSNNVMLARSASGALRAVITDFGIAKQDVDDSEGRPLEASGVAGAPAYMAPERLRGDRASAVSDIYSLGVVLYEMVTGRLPSVHDGVTALIAPSRIAPGLPRRWDRCIRRCLVEDPAERPASAADVASILDRRAWKTWVTSAALLLAIASVAALLRTSPAPSGTPIRLALLPFSAPPGDERVAELAGGVLHDVSERLQRLAAPGTQLLVIPFVESLKYNVTDPEQARTRLGATHVLSGHVIRAGEIFRVRASVADTRTLMTARELSAEYPSSALSLVPAALAGTVTAGLRINATRLDDSIEPAAYAPFALGMFHLRADVARADRAIPPLKEAARLDRRSALPHAALTEAFTSKFVSTGDQRWLDLARQSLANAESRDPDVALVRIASGRVHRALGMHDKAADDFSRATELEPNNVSAWVGLGRAYEAAQTRPTDAAAAYQRAVDLQPDYYLPHLEFGSFYYFRGEYDRAEQHFQRATVIAPDLVAPYTNLGGLYADLGRYADAERMLRRSLALDESSAALTNLGAVLNYQRRDAEALAYYRKALAHGPADFVLMVNIGDSCRRAGRAAEATDAYREGLTLADSEVLTDPRNGYARAFVAYFAARLGRRDRARREIEQAMRFSPQDGKVIRRAVLTYHSLGEHDRALALLETAPPAVVQELSRQPDLVDLSQHAAFQRLLERGAPQKTEDQ
jgi:tetratricopeptide (TPR) repeat protein/TolB-like protein